MRNADLKDVKESYGCTRQTHKHHMNDPTRSIGHIYVITNYIWRILLLVLIVWRVCFKCRSLSLIEYINLDFFSRLFCIFRDE